MIYKHVTTRQWPTGNGAGSTCIKSHTKTKFVCVKGIGCWPQSPQRYLISPSYLSPWIVTYLVFSAQSTTRDYTGADHTASMPSATQQRKNTKWVQTHVSSFTAPRSFLLFSKQHGHVFCLLSKEAYLATLICR